MWPEYKQVGRVTQEVFKGLCGVSSALADRAQRNLTSIRRCDHECCLREHQVAQCRGNTFKSGTGRTFDESARSAQW